jgi:hypothetical protein
MRTVSVADIRHEVVYHAWNGYMKEPVLEDLLEVLVIPDLQRVMRTRLRTFQASMASDHEILNGPSADPPLKTWEAVICESVAPDDLYHDHLDSDYGPQDFSVADCLDHETTVSHDVEIENDPVYRGL